LEHGLDLRTSCFLAATASLLSSFTRDSDLEGEPLLADTTLVVLKSHVFTLSASQNFMNFGFWKFWFVFFRISPAAAELLELEDVVALLLHSSRLTQLNVPGKEY